MFSRSFSSQPIRRLPRVSTISTPTAPLPAAPYSQATKFKDLIFVSGQVPLTTENKLVQGTITEKSEQVIKNVKNILNACNSDLNHILKATVFLSDMKNFTEFNAVYSKYFAAYKPARTCTAVSNLPLNVDIELEVIAVEKE